MIAAAILIGIAAAFWDARTIANGRINHLLHGGVRVAALALALYFLTGFNLESVGYLAVMGITFRRTLNFFMNWTWDHIGTTAYYDRVFNWVFPSAPGQLAYSIEVLVMALAFIL